MIYIISFWLTIKIPFEQIEQNRRFYIVVVIVENKLSGVQEIDTSSLQRINRKFNRAIKVTIIQYMKIFRYTSVTCFHNRNFSVFMTIKMLTHCWEFPWLLILVNNILLSCRMFRALNFFDLMFGMKFISKHRKLIVFILFEVGDNRNCFFEKLKMYEIWHHLKIEVFLVENRKLQNTAFHTYCN